MKTCFKDAERSHEDITAPAPHTVPDLFADCGGMSTGFEMTGLDVVCASDSWDVAADTYRRNHPGTQFVLGDSREKEVKARIVDASKDRECDILVSGIPCVVFSMKHDNPDGLHFPMITINPPGREALLTYFV